MEAKMRSNEVEDKVKAKTYALSLTSYKVISEVPMAEFDRINNRTIKRGKSSCRRGYLVPLGEI